ncbi:hypothetical protein [Spirilliplanes yamanashiensis]|uniref:hypothetical protein n=1 Tax=Spirilliplanes yamanashiensis TaxID=42233 RepID=UPI0019516FBE|nr:hypothetical protein [Spirilliplanes yamanashiensis]MDP9818377.1 cytoskeletal protein RodZ [Spirilliplanes yamanashiensis]
MTVVPTSAGRSRAARAAGGAVLGSVGLTALAINAEDKANHTFGLIVWILAGVVLAVGGAAAVWLWVAAVVRERRDGPRGTVIPASSVVHAASNADGGRVAVTIQTDDGASRTFSAPGRSGGQLATQFGSLLGVEAPKEVRDEIPAQSTAQDRPSAADRDSGSTTAR